MAEPLVVRLVAGQPVAPATLGGKGASIARLVDSGVTVPPTCVVTTEAYLRAAADPGLAAFVAQARTAPDDELLPADAVDAAFLAAPMPPDIDAAIRTSVADLDAPLAVRSSATAEDLRTASFAGQYRSSLDVRGGDAALRAVRLTWASLWHPNAVAYRRAWGSDPDRLAMAVVLMTMVDAQQAGVVFTVDPAGDATRCRVETVEGLGESLVSGSRTPSVTFVDRAPLLGAAPPPGAGPEALAAHAALDVEAREGAPQDVEWAWDGAVLWVVQARPITTVTGDGFDSPPDDRELVTAGIAEMLPGVLPPLRWEIDRFLVEEAFRHTLAEAGVPVTSSGLLRRVDGRAAVDFDALRQSAERLGPGLGLDLERRYFRDPGTPTAAGAASAMPPARRGRTLGRGVVAQVRSSASRRRALDDAVVVIATGLALAERTTPLGGSSDAELWAYRSRLVDLGARAMTTELAVAAVAVAAFDRLERWLVPYLGEDGGAAAAQRLTVVTRRRRSPKPSASRAVFAGPTWAESGRALPPAVPGDGLDPGEEQRAVEALLTGSARWRHTRPLGAGVVDLRLHMLRRLVDDATHCLATREETKDALLTVGGEVRRVHLELGRRLVERGLIGTATDVELLDAAELQRALRDGWLPTALVGQRRRAHTRSAAMPPLPERFRADARSRETPAAPSRSEVGTVLEGWAAGAGVHTGIATFLTDPEHPDALARGAVLVAVQTDASWLPVFLRAGAIVVERGGPLSHAAIVARELGLPAVCNVPDAARMLDGSTVTVDGDRGVIVVHDASPTGAA